MSGVPQFHRLMSVMGTGVASSDPGNWQVWIGHVKTPEVMCRVSELGPDLMLKVLEGAPSPLAHGLFRRVEQQVILWREWLPILQEDQGVNADLDTFLAEHEAPAWPGNRLTAVTLTLRGPSAPQEFQLYWPLIAAQQEQSWKWDDLKFDDDHMRWLKGSDNTANDWRFEWQVIDLGANRKTSSETVRQAHGDKPQPNVGILAAAALHSTWIKSMNGKDVPYVDLPGYEVSVPDCRPWQDVPRLSFSRDYRGVRLSTYRCDYTASGWAVPSFAGV